MATKKLNAKAVILKAWKAIAGAETAIHDVTKLDLELTAGRLKRSGDRARVPQEWKDLAKKIRDEQKSLEIPKFREAAFPIFIAELKRRHPNDKRIDLISWAVFKRTYLRK